MARFVDTCTPCSGSKCASTIPASRIVWRSQGNTDCGTNVCTVGKQDFMKEMKQPIMWRSFMVIFTRCHHSLPKRIIHIYRSFHVSDYFTQTKRMPPKCVIQKLFILVLGQMGCEMCGRGTQ